MSWNDRTDQAPPPEHPEQPTRISDLALSLIRTWVPVAVAAVVTWLATRWGIIVPDDLAGEAVVWIVAGVAGGYYYLARRLEQIRGERLGARIARAVGRWLLGGVVVAPTYRRPVRSG